MSAKAMAGVVFELRSSFWRNAVSDDGGPYDGPPGYFPDQFRFWPYARNTDGERHMAT